MASICAAFKSMHSAGVQTNTALLPNSLEQYITAVEETFNATSQPTTIDQSSSNSQSSGGGLLGRISNAISNSTIGKVISTIGSFDNLGTLADAAVDTLQCASFSVKVNGIKQYSIHAEGEGTRSFRKFYGGSFARSMYVQQGISRFLKQWCLLGVHLQLRATQGQGLTLISRILPPWHR